VSEPRDPNQTADITSEPADSLDAGLAAGFGRQAGGPGSVLSGMRESLGPLQPVLLREAEGESAHVVKPKSDAMPTPEETGDRYQLSGEIARGGMGAVLRGRDVDLGRDLAVKVLLEKYANRPEIARRFIEEAQIGGQLQHPGVVPVYDIGRFGDRPFFTMKLLKGQTLAAILCERTDPAADRPRLLAIALQVAQTLAYAHAKGVIHRDLKPANIMVGAFGEVQVMDWGLAKVLAEGGIADEERASQQHRRPEDVTTIRTARSGGSTGSGLETEAGSLLGTPAYMPPEQANGDIATLDRRADVFGLGAILCEILTGSPPYVGRSGEEVRRKAANGDLANACARLDGCGADAELIGLTRTCLAAEAMDRPKDARAVADGLTAYLDGVQERLRRVELERAREVVRIAEERKRRRVQLALAASVAVLALVGGVVGAWWWQARSAAIRDVETALEELHAHVDAARWPEARAALGRAQGRLAAGGTELLRERIRQARADLDMVSELEEVRLLCAQVKDDHFDRTPLHPGYSAAFRAFGLDVLTLEPEEAVSRIASSAVRERLIVALDTWATYRRSENKEEADRLWLIANKADSDQWRKQLRTPEFRDNVSKLVALAADKAAVEQPPEALDLLGNLLYHKEKYNEAVSLLRSAQIRHPDDFWINELLGLCLGSMENLRAAQAIGYYRAAVAIRPTSPGALLNLSTALKADKQQDEAIACLHKAIQLKPDYAMAHSQLGYLLRDKGGIEGAVTAYRKAIELDPGDANAHNGLGALLNDNKHDHVGGAAEFRRAIEIAPENSVFHANLGFALADNGDWAGAAAVLRKAVELDCNLPQVRQYLGNALEHLNDWPGAVALYRNAVASHPNNAELYVRLARALEHQGKKNEPVATLREAVKAVPTDPYLTLWLGLELTDDREAIAAYRKTLELDPKNAVALIKLGDYLAEAGNLAEAADAYGKALASALSLIQAESRDVTTTICLAYSPNCPQFAPVTVSNGAFGGNETELQMYFSSHLVPARLYAHLDLAPLQWKYGMLLQRTGRLATAVGALRRAHALGGMIQGWSEPSAELLRRTETQVELEKKFSAYLNGSVRPSNTAERIALADLCHIKGFHAAATQFYIVAFTDDLKSAHCFFDAACCAAPAATGQGNDAGQLDEKERTRLRKLALDWLRADLALRTKQLESGPPADRAKVQKALKQWQLVKDLASIRDKDALAKLSPEERGAFTKLWADVTTLLKKAEQKPK
jgi:serine/threonine protein kinase/Tfp pilus assembly protein PilF